MRYRSRGEGQFYLLQHVRVFKGISSTAVCDAKAGPEKLIMVTKNRLLALLPKMLKIIVLIMFKGSISAEILSESEKHAQPST